MNEKRGMGQPAVERERCPEYGMDDHSQRKRNDGADPQAGEKTKRANVGRMVRRRSEPKETCDSNSKSTHQDPDDEDLAEQRIAAAAIQKEMNLRSAHKRAVDHKKEPRDHVMHALPGALEQHIDGICALDIMLKQHLPRTKSLDQNSSLRLNARDAFPRKMRKLNHIAECGLHLDNPVVRALQHKVLELLLALGENTNHKAAQLAEPVLDTRLDDLACTTARAEELEHDAVPVEELQELGPGPAAMMDVRDHEPREQGFEILIVVVCPCVKLCIFRRVGHQISHMIDKLRRGCRLALLESLVAHDPQGERDDDHKNHQCKRDGQKGNKLDERMQTLWHLASATKVLAVEQATGRVELQQRDKLALPRIAVERKIVAAARKRRPKRHVPHIGLELQESVIEVKLLELLDHLAGGHREHVGLDHRRQRRWQRAQISDG
eukprot:comp22449_c0_seq1/m.55191 comp22449_c0_seq1/g.55191  ORF comp22449_c0_seq1/g.55191 comp22449_c0_seq1/m.55191 type:complete len:437 (+) comp22449_c0_seq1:2257-3567(+)